MIKQDKKERIRFILSLPMLLVLFCSGRECLAQNVALPLPNIHRWPIQSFDQEHKICGTLGECREENGSFHFHGGVDIPAGNGTNVYSVYTDQDYVVEATAPRVSIFLRMSWSGANWDEWRDGNDDQWFTHRYLHVKEIQVEKKDYIVTNSTLTGRAYDSQIAWWVYPNHLPICEIQDLSPIGSPSGDHLHYEEICYDGISGNEFDDGYFRYNPLKTLNPYDDPRDPVIEEILLYPQGSNTPITQGSGTYNSPYRIGKDEYGNNITKIDVRVHTHDVVRDPNNPGNTNNVAPYIVEVYIYDENGWSTGITNNYNFLLLGPTTTDTSTATVSQGLGYVYDTSVSNTSEYYFWASNGYDAWGGGHDHYLDIWGLNAGTKYFVEVTIKDIENRTARDTVWFTTPPPEDNLLPIIQDIYLTEETDSTESPYSSTILERKNYDIIVQTYDWDAFQNQREVKKVEYRYYIEGASGTGWTVGFDSTNFDMTHIYADGTDRSIHDYRYIVTNNNQSNDNGTFSLTDSTAYPTGAKVIVEARVTDSNNNPATLSKSFYVVRQSYPDDLDPVIEKVYFAYEEDESETALGEYKDVHGRTQLPKKNLDIIVHVRDKKYDSNGNVVDCEVKQIVLEYYNNDLDRWSLFRWLTLPVQDYYSTSGGNPFRYAGPDSNTINYHYIITNDTSSDAGYWNPNTIDDEIRFSVYAEDWKGNSTVRKELGFFVAVDSFPPPNGVVDGQIIPDYYVLSQNYPNPFNPETKIDYQLPEASHVTVSIHNLMGQEIKKLVDGYKPAGFYTNFWDGKDEYGINVSSGVYFCIIKTANYHDSKKLILLR